MSLITLAEAKRHLRIDVSSTKSDAMIQEKIDAATKAIERHLGESVATGARTETHYRCSGLIFVNWPPIVSVTSVTSTDGEDSWTSADLLIDLELGRLEAKTTADPLRGNLTVVYEAGRSTVPDNIKEATKITLAYMWETQNPGRQSDPRFGTAEGSAPVIAGFSDLPNRAKALLGPSVSGMA